jgi:hypothetical protein
VWVLWCRTISQSASPAGVNKLDHKHNTRQFIGLGRAKSHCRIWIQSSFHVSECRLQFLCSECQYRSESILRDCVLELAKGPGDKMFREGKILITIVHLGIGKVEMDGADYWVPLIIDGKNRCFHYEDSLQKIMSMPPKLSEAYNVWRSEHTESPFPINALPITYQTNRHSCGPLLGAGGGEVARM